jgi:hypothetical protein
MKVNRDNCNMWKRSTIIQVPTNNFNILLANIPMRCNRLYNLLHYQGSRYAHDKNIFSRSPQIRASILIQEIPLFFRDMFLYLLKQELSSHDLQIHFSRHCYMRPTHHPP